nr:hypothetical protein [Pedobacter panaciterrae]
MKNQKTPKPGSRQYDPRKTEALNTPKYHSSSDRRNSDELPAAENLNDQLQGTADEKIKEQDIPKTDLGNKRNGNEKQREKIITP